MMINQPRGVVIGNFSEYDALVEYIRQRAAEVGLSYSVIDELAGFAEGQTGKYLAPLRVRHLSIESLLKITSVLGLAGVLYIDEALLKKIRPQWTKRDAKRVHAKRQALGQVQMGRVLPVAAREMGRRGGNARFASTTPEQRRLIGKTAAYARWGKKTILGE